MRHFISAVAVILASAAVHAEELKMAVTTSFANSGLAEVLTPRIKQDTGIDLQLFIVGTGQALKLGAAADVDAVLVHARDAEDRFIAGGHGTHRREIMYNDFVILGPTQDPANVRQATSAEEALRAIAGYGAAFVSRGDDSGTHQREMSLWEAADVTAHGDWYKPVGQGMGAAINTAAAMNAYIMSDRASWLNFGNKGELTILFEGDPILFNQYTFIPVNPDGQPHVNAEAAAQLEVWLTGAVARDLINGYKIDGEGLFTFNAAPAPAAD